MSLGPDCDQQTTNDRGCLGSLFLAPAWTVLGSPSRRSERWTEGGRLAGEGGLWLGKEICAGRSSLPVSPTSLLVEQVELGFSQTQLLEDLKFPSFSQPYVTETPSTDDAEGGRDTFLPGCTHGESIL